MLIDVVVYWYLTYIILSCIGILIGLYLSLSNRDKKVILFLSVDPDFAIKTIVYCLSPYHIVRGKI